ncbi:hypothetical protein EIP91_010229 [Steccherinum ochraceum]|uniref:Uncharacterized protein n=1 Tax=Steccherinum ochraceum TaxID=92696 RepID=A0A4R0R3G2_9APHY|nr:hypothetical protein EIP91_010229 [Steccherinum ochraceum]
MLQSPLLHRFPFSRSQDSPRKSKVPLSNSTNVPRRTKKAKSLTAQPTQTPPAFSLSPRTKSTATVSLSNANAFRTTSSSPPGLSEVPLNLIPFPSSTPFPSTPAEQDLDLDLLSFVVVEKDGEEEKGSPSLMRAATAWRIDLRRRRSKSCLVPSSFICGAPSQHDFPLHLDIPTLPSVAPAYPRRSQSTSDGKSGKRKPVVPRTTKAVKRAKKAKKQTADLQFVAMMHRSILCYLSSAPAACAGLVASRHKAKLDVLRQDDLLIERLWQNLKAQGFKPIPLELDDKDDTPLLPGLISALSPEHDLAQRAKSLPPLSIPQTLTPVSEPTSSPVRSEHVPDVLSMPQLVATLILRHNDRCSTRFRSASARKQALKNSPHTQVRQRSPLHRSIAVAGDQDSA